MPAVVGVRFKQAGPVYYFDPAGIEIEPGLAVVVETSRGPAIGRTVTSVREIDESEATEPLKPVLRLAQLEDFEQQLEASEREAQAQEKCEDLVERFHLPMKVLAAEYNLDCSHLTVFFRAEKRVDFRALLRELSSALKTRVELRQVGARDAAKLVGGVGMCGLPLCCSTHLCRFESISMRMARDQDLPLNPANISGVCGRLLCCLSFENQQYKEMKQMLPHTGTTVVSPLGRGKVVAGNAIKETVAIQLDSGAVVEVALADVGKSPAERRG